MTDHELAVKMVKEGIEVFKELNEGVLAPYPSALTVSLIPVLLVTCCQAVYNVHMMKQLAASMSNKEVKIDPASISALKAGQR